MCGCGAGLLIGRVAMCVVDPVKVFLVGVWRPVTYILLVNTERT